MSYNKGLEKKKFDEQIKKQEAWYRKEGMSEEAIKAMTEFDTDWFNSCRREYEHTQRLEPFIEDIEEEGKNPLIERFQEAMTYYMEPLKDNIYWWIDEIENQAALKAVSKMDFMTVTIVSLVVFCGYRKDEVAKMLGITTRNVYWYLETKAKDLCIRYGFVPKGGDDNEEE